MSDEELYESVKAWIGQNPEKVAAAITYLLMSDGDHSEALEVEKEFHRWLNN